jgi:competence protein ComFB
VPVVNTGTAKPRTVASMQLRNYQEEIVLAVIPLVLQDYPEIAQDETLVHDVAAYVLNRLPPRYIMSERGLTRIAAEHWILDPEQERPRKGADGLDRSLAGMVQLMLLVNKALEVVESRRRSGPQGGSGPRRRGKRPTDGIALDEGYWHNFPQIIGRVLDAKSRSPVLGATVTVRAGRLGVLRTERGWRNPCTTSRGTDGYFSLWPRALRDGKASRSLTLQVAFEHPDYAPATRRYPYRSRGELLPGDELRLDRVINLGVELLAPLGRRR